MKRFRYCAAFILFLLVGNLATASDIIINFSDANINEARKKAGEEGKLLFIDFHAKWCTPCKWMEQTTFKDDAVVNILNSDFVSLKIDIDDTKGYEIKKMYDIKYLPTMLIFNSQGQLVARIEETLSPRLLMDVLDKHNAPENKIIMKHDFNVAPSTAVTPIPEPDDMMMSREAYQKYFQEAQTQSSYKVQVGVFGNFESANNLVKKIRETFLEDVTVINEYRDGQPMFKVRMGQFSSYDEAESFRKILKSDYNMNGIVQ